MLSGAITTVAAFVATNIDELAILVVLYGQHRPARTVVVGQYLGFAAIVAASLLVSAGAMLIPRAWVGLLGLAPIAIGIKGLLSAEKDEKEIAASSAIGVSAVASIAIASGGDNIAVYAPLFAIRGAWEIAAMAIGFFVLLGVWCWLAAAIVTLPGVRTVLERWGRLIAPVVLVVLGVYIILRAGSVGAIVGAMG